MTIQVHEVLTKYWEKLDLQVLSPALNIDISLPAEINAAKFMDDATCQEVVDITTSLASNRDRSGPLPFWECSGKILPGENFLL